MHSPKKSIVIYNKDWHKGIIGIVASRLTELYAYLFAAESAGSYYGSQPEIWV